MVIKFYYEDIPQKGDRFPTKMQELIEKVMEQVRKEHYSTFCKHSPICDPGLGLEFLEEIQAHYDNNSKLKMFTKKLQMFVYSSMSKEQKVPWLRQWNESKVLKEAKKFPK